VKLLPARVEKARVFWKFLSDEERYLKANSLGLSTLPVA